MRVREVAVMIEIRRDVLGNAVASEKWAMLIETLGNAPLPSSDLLGDLDADLK